MNAEAKALGRRFPKRGIDPTIPESVRARMVEMEKDRERERMGRKYDEIMPSPEPGESAPRKFAKGGVTRADGCVKKGHTKGTMR